MPGESADLQKRWDPQAWFWGEAGWSTHQSEATRADCGLLWGVETTVKLGQRLFLFFNLWPMRIILMEGCGTGKRRGLLEANSVRTVCKGVSYVLSGFARWKGWWSIRHCPLVGGGEWTEGMVNRWAIVKKGEIDFNVSFVSTPPLPTRAQRDFLPPFRSLHHKPEQPPPVPYLFPLYAAEYIQCA